MTTEKSLSRRRFIQNSASAAALATTLARPAAARVIGANDRINIAVIGCGGMGREHIRRLNRRVEEQGDIQFVAVCDVYERRKEQARELAGLSRKDVYGHYGGILDRSDVDVCWIATPDHWHARIAIDAMRAGKDIYLEKPMTRIVEEAKEVAQTAEETGAVVQVGAQGASLDSRWRARGIIEAGEIGKVVWSQASAARNSLDGEWNWGIDPDANESNVDWQTWLGDAPSIPWTPDRFFRFRKYWDYSGGIATDLFYHDLAGLSVPLGAEFPHRVTGSGGIWVQKDEREVPDTFFATIDFPSEHSVVLVGSMANSRGVETVIRGHEGSINLDKLDGITVRPDSDFRKGFVKRHGGEELFVPAYQSHEQKRDIRYAHRDNFLQCVRTRAQTNLNAQAAYRVMVSIGMCVDSYRRGQMLFWDAEKEEVVARDPGPRERA